MITENAWQPASALVSLPGALSSADVREFLQPELSEGQMRAAEALLEQATAILERLTQATVPRFNGRGSLTLRWARGETFNAGALKLFADGHDYLIEISVGAPIVLLAMAHEIWHPAERAHPSRVLAEQDVLSGHMRPGEVTPVAYRTALDATYLLYFHELAHVLCNHCELEWGETAAVDRRALEYQADYLAGSTFVSHKAWSNKRRPTDWCSIAEALVSAALLLSTAFKGFAAPSDGYHLPTNRLIAFMDGGFQAILDHCALQTEAPPFADVNTESAFIRPLMLSFLEHLRASALERLAGTESEIASDSNQVHTVTRPRAQELSASMGSLWTSLESGVSN
ncbi:hypothetical protein [uncultured Stenotrophomonas sp.]|uniref:hypothetical protein n=1 Tax=uncultured Stenotrophomonas sp. TaxID=165438 RepID=UPI0025FAD536|nr:hypothetical protein [uncultured Stenotrophomonas sp.]